MFTIIKNISCYAPEFLGVKDIIISQDKILKILESGKFEYECALTKQIDGTALMAFPGMIDGHVHIIGGGGEEGFASRIDEISIADVYKAGITTVTGLLGADDQTKSLFALLAKAKAMEEQGITTYIYSGSYSVPVVTFTGDIKKDMLLIDKVIGAGEIAISDHRSSHPDINQLLNLGSKIHMGALLSDKAGLLHFHLGDGKSGFRIINEIRTKSDLPPDLFLPTHVNRNKELFSQAIQYLETGGYIDLTSGEENGIPVPDAVETLILSGADMQNVTISSDANGSIPCGSVGKIQTLFDDVIRCIAEKGISPENIFPLITKNAALRLKQYPRKGAIHEGSDADILILNKQYELQMLFSMGEIKIDQRGAA